MTAGKGGWTCAAPVSGRRAHRAQVAPAGGLRVPLPGTAPALNRRLPQSPSGQPCCLSLPVVTQPSAVSAAAVLPDPAPLSHHPSPLSARCRRPPRPHDGQAEACVRSPAPLHGADTTSLPCVTTPPPRVASERPFSGSSLTAPSLTQTRFADCVCPGCGKREEGNTASGGRWPAPGVCSAPRPGVGSVPHHRPLPAPHTGRCGACGTPAEMLLLSPVTQTLGRGFSRAKLQCRLSFYICCLPGRTVRFKGSQ